ncbi:hypothetical protein A2768_02115 [Candidatus Roizmanbacteria bacterium RIFCSPHIGHO2_01_FULL_37_16]|nr:MAG: hypothetical protein A2768_02115 [Candidatus Roizmanbacteria bacterium RIFCSPHIGHO2_01_FULL_37_16]OGK23719.1 MAG: hypothetical protein A3D76_04065 [Candidatus Roizmanbacteria bacterium RIFCSPHIGHO2_02_FULL_37_9b]
MKTLVLVGSGEFTDAMLKVDKFLIKLVKHIKGRSKINIAIIPTASVPDGRQINWINDGVKHFKKLEINPFGLNIVNRQDANKKVNLRKLKTASIIYFSGGHPGYLLEIFKHTQAWKLIETLYNNGVMLVGTSAGAMILGNYLLGNAQETFNKEEKPLWIKGFNLVPFAIFPHYDWAKRHKPKLLVKLIESASRKISANWLGIDENTAVIISDGKKTKIMGKGSVTMQRGNETLKYNTGQKFLI